MLGSEAPVEVTLKLLSLLLFSFRKELGILITSVAREFMCSVKKILYLTKCC